MDRADKKIIVETLEIISFIGIIILPLINFMMWNFNWFTLRAFILGIILYLVSYYIHQTIKEEKK